MNALNRQQMQPTRTTGYVFTRPGGFFIPSLSKVLLETCHVLGTVTSVSHTGCSCREQLPNKSRRRSTHHTPKHDYKLQWLLERKGWHFVGMRSLNESTRLHGL